MSSKTPPSGQRVNPRLSPDWLIGKLREAAGDMSYEGGGNHPHCKLLDDAADSIEHLRAMEIKASALDTVVTHLKARIERLTFALRRITGCSLQAGHEVMSTSKNRVIDHLDQVVDCLRYRPVTTTALQMRQAADEIQRCWREHDEDVERMERAAIVIERLRAALQWYAKADYEHRVCDDGDGHIDEWGAEEILADKGKRAREALAGVETSPAPPAPGLKRDLTLCPNCGAEPIPPELMAHSSLPAGALFCGQCKFTWRPSENGSG
jgi:ribosomal protein S27AE